MGDSEGVLGHLVLKIGWCCLVGTSIVLFDLLTLLPLLPASWWLPEQGGSSLDLKTMFVDFGLGSLGWIGYVVAFAWVPAAILLGVCGRFRGRRASRTEILVLIAICLLLFSVSALVRLTPLRYVHFNVSFL